MALEEWWFNLRTQKVEQGQGDPNSERLGPYATRDEAKGVLERMRRRNEAFDKRGRRLTRSRGVDLRTMRDDEEGPTP